MTRRPLARRTLLRGAGGVVVALPWLEAMAPRRAQAAPPRRLVIFFSPNGTNDYAQFMPQSAERMGSNFTLGSETAPLMAIKDKLLLLHGIKLATAENQKRSEGGDEHAMAMSHVLTGRRSIRVDGYETPAGADVFVSLGGGISVDQRVAEMVGRATRFPSIELGVQTTVGIGVHPFSRMIYKGPSQIVPPIDDPVETWRRLFSGLSPPAGGGTTPAPMIDRTLAERRSVLDFVRGQVAELSARVGAQDRQKLDAHLTGIREIEQRLSAGVNAAAQPAGAGCRRPEQPVAPRALTDLQQYPQVGKLQMDLLTLALACDLTRVASLQWSWARTTMSMPWIGVQDSHHDLSHDEPSSALSAINRWYAEQLVYLARAMQAVDEGGTSLLDSAVIWWCSDVSHGDRHTFENARAFLVGRCGGFFRTGQHVRYDGAPHNQLLVTLLRAMGLSDNQFGDPTLPAGPLPGLA